MASVETTKNRRGEIMKPKSYMRDYRNYPSSDKERSRSIGRAMFVVVGLIAILLGFVCSECGSAIGLIIGLVAGIALIVYSIVYSRRI